MTTGPVALPRHRSPPALHCVSEVRERSCGIRSPLRHRLPSLSSSNGLRSGPTRKVSLSAQPPQIVRKFSPTTRKGRRICRMGRISDNNAPGDKIGCVSQACDDHQRGTTPNPGVDDHSYLSVATHPPTITGRPRRAAPAQPLRSHRSGRDPFVMPCGRCGCRSGGGSVRRRRLVCGWRRRGPGVVRRGGAGSSPGFPAGSGWRGLR